MQKTLKISLLAAFMTVFSTINLFAQSEEEKNVQMIVHLLSYVSMDYSEAVENGKVTNEDEYKEQVEFSAKAHQLAQTSSILKDSKEEILKDLKQLIKLVDDKKEANKISAQVTLVKNKIIKVTGIKTSPRNWPNLETGKAIYARSCTECHGAKGDGLGQLAQTLDPKPSSFLEAEQMQKISPYQAYNTIRLGVEGTGMRSFTELSEEQAWDLAFYVKSILYASDADNTQKLQKEFDTLHTKVTLEQISTLSDNDLQEV